MINFGKSGGSGSGGSGSDGGGSGSGWKIGASTSLLLTLSKVMNGEKHKAQAYKATKRSSSRRENY